MLADNVHTDETNAVNRSFLSIIYIVGFRLMLQCVVRIGRRERGEADREENDVHLKCSRQEQF